jgi:hypothetical protein
VRFTRWRRAHFLRVLEETGPVQMAAEAAGVSLGCIYRLRRVEAGFIGKMIAAAAKADSRLAEAGQSGDSHATVTDSSSDQVRDDGQGGRRGQRLAARGATAYAGREGVAGMNGLIAIGAILAAAPAAGEAAPPDREQFDAAAARCGLPANLLRVGRDADGDFADPSPDGKLERLDTKALVCLIDWAERTGARIGFISEPPPGTQTIAQGPIEGIRRAAKAARECGLPVHIDPLSPEEAVLDARRDAPPGPLECARSWIGKQRDLR